MKYYWTFIVILLLVCGQALGQIVSSSVRGTVVDPSGGLIVGATCTLTNSATRQASTAPSLADGACNFTNVDPGTYNLSVTAPGFKGLEMSSVVVDASEIRTLGRLTLSVGEARETVTVAAESAAIQLASGERSGLITGSQLGLIAIKGRDLMSFMQTISGVVDVAAGSGRESMDPTATQYISLNGNDPSQSNVTIDGIYSKDAGNNTKLHYEPSMDAVAEVRVQMSNYEAEYGRMGGGSITMIIKSGSQDFHGSAYDVYRHESLNANNFFNNQSGTPQSPYRYRISGGSIGGPIYIPRKFNADRSKLFFFFSEEFCGIKQDRGFVRTNMPTAAELNGDFSHSYDVGGNRINIKDPLAPGTYFPGNVIPASRIDPNGQGMLSAFPRPNYTDTNPLSVNSWNYKVSSSTPYPKRQEIARVDANPWSSLRMFGRIANNKDHQVNEFGHWTTNATNFNLAPIVYDEPGKGFVYSATKIFSPTFISESTVGMDQNRLFLDALDPNLISRSTWGNLPKWYTFQSTPYTNPTYMPDIYFGGNPANTPIVMNTTWQGLARYPWHDLNRDWSGMQNMTKMLGTHEVKFGAYIEEVSKNDPTPSAYRGMYNFSVSSLNPLDTNDSFANALLGVYNTYLESNARWVTNTHAWNIEAYVQDNWKVTRRFTLDYGLRFYHWTPCYDEAMRQSTFDSSAWNPSQATVLYRPALNSAGLRVAENPLTGALTSSAALIGKVVPNSGNVTDGIVIGGVTPGIGRGVEKFPALDLGPRFGFAWDVSGNGNTAVRGGFGLYYSRVTAGANMNTGGNPPSIYTPTSYYGTIATLTQSAGAIGPLSVFGMEGNVHLPSQMSYSLGIQHRVKTTVVEVSYVGGLGRHLYASKQWNPIPMFARFAPANQDPTTPGKPLLDDFMRPYQGYTSITLAQPQATTNYNSVQVSANRRLGKGFQYGVSYTFSKALGTTSFNPYFAPRSWDYGPLAQDRPMNLVFNYIYDLPQLGSRLNSKPARWVLDNWQVSGITTFQSGAPFTPTLTTTNGADITGSEIAARITVTGDPVLSKSDKTFYQTFNTSDFSLTPKGSFGNAGNGLLYGPGVNNWDFSIAKRIPLGSEQRALTFRAESYNTLNHTQFSGVDSTAAFNPAGKQTDPLFGSYNAARDPRRISFTLRLTF